MYREQWDPSAATIMLCKTATGCCRRAGAPTGVQNSLYSLYSVSENRVYLQYNKYSFMELLEGRI